MTLLLFLTMQRKPTWLVDVSTGWAMARGRPVAAAVVGRAEVRAALEHLARNSDLRLAGVVALRPRGPPRGFSGMQHAFGASAACFGEYQSVVHSQTLPIMS